VLDTSRVMAGPYCTMLLGDLGADVVKIEPMAGDDTRRWGPPFHNGTAAYFYSINRNKRSVQLDFRSEGDLAVLRELLSQADIFVHNMLPSSVSRLQIDYDNVSRINPRCIYCSISGFGSSDPNRKAYDLIIQALGGLMVLTGSPGGPPTKVGVPIADIAAGLFAAIGILGALLERSTTGRGKRVDVSLSETVPALLVNHAMSWLLCGVEPEPLGNEHPSVVPYTVFPTRDGYLAIGGATDEQFQSLCEAISKPELPDDERYATNASRVANREALNASIADVFLGADADEWELRLAAAGVPAARVRRVSEVLDDPALAGGLVTSVGGWHGERVPQVLTPIRLDGKLLEPFLPPPDLGEHTARALPGKP
jgi:crotonobetainyl-CoA:carnitine CoA-transferase CaiB-like acyl-CoA transferase